MVDRYSFHLENVEGQDLTTVLEAFCLEYYGSAPSVPPQIVVPREAGDLVGARASSCRRRAARASRCAPPSAARSGGCSELADENARHALVDRPGGDRAEAARRVEALEELREALNLESLPIRIECFDISTRHGPGPRRLDGRLPGRACRRRPTTASSGSRTASGEPDDFAAMAEVVSRRFARARPTATGETYDESFAAAPNLVVIDGGKGQLSAALAAMQAYDLPRVAVIALAKRIEEVFVPGQREPIVLVAAHRRPPAPPADPRRGAPLRARLPPAAARARGFASIFDDAGGRRARAPARAAAALRLGRADARGDPGGARGRAGRPGEDGARDLRAAPQGRPRLARLFYRRFTVRSTSRSTVSEAWSCTTSRTTSRSTLVRRSSWPTSSRTSCAAFRAAVADRAPSVWSLVAGQRARPHGASSSSGGSVEPSGSRNG